MTIEATARIDALRVYVETLETELATGVATGEVIEVSRLARHLRSILETPLTAEREGPDVEAMQDLSVWSAYNRLRLQPAALVGMLSAEAVAMTIEVGRSREQFLRTMGKVWDSLAAEIARVEREEREAAGGESDA